MSLTDCANVSSQAAEWFYFAVLISQHCESHSAASLSIAGDVGFASRIKPLGCVTCKVIQ